MKKTRLSAVASLLAAGVMMGGCLADFGGESESEGGAAQGPSVVEGEALGEAQQALTCGVLSGGQTLSMNQSNWSCDGRYLLITQTDGNVVLYGPTGAVWATYIGGPGNRLVMQGDGNLVVYTPSNVPVWSSGTAGNPGARLAIQNDGNLVIYSRNNHALWSIRSCGGMSVGQTLSMNQSIWSCNGSYLLITQTDGNVVLYGPTGAVWATYIGGAGNRLVMQGDGNLVVYTPSNVPVWSSGTSGHYGAKLAVTNDGKLELYTPSGHVLWHNACRFATCGPMDGIRKTPPVASRSYHSLAVKSDGTVWAWGWNDLGQLGDGTKGVDRSLPVPVSGLTGVVGVAAGTAHSLAVKSNGTLWAWGGNFYGQLGDGTTTDRLTPVPVQGLTGVMGVATGNSHVLAVKSDGTLWAWGYNGYGQLGDGTTTDSLTPKPVSGLTGVVAVAAGEYHSLAVKSDGTLWAWGNNNSGQLGDGTNTARSTPMPVLTDVVGVAAGSYHSLAVKSDGTLWAWGLNFQGQLGSGTTTGHLTPKQVPNLTGVVAVAAGNYHSLAIKSDGMLWSWGSNSSGQLGDGTTSPSRSVPLPVSLPGGVVAMDAGSSHSLAVKSDGTLWSWGSNSRGQLGDGTTSPRSAPGPLPGLPVKL